jgi:hypothetical protein
MGEQNDSGGLTVASPVSRVLLPDNPNGVHWLKAIDGRNLSL